MLYIYDFALQLSKLIISVNYFVNKWWQLSLYSGVCFPKALLTIYGRNIQGVS